MTRTIIAILGVTWALTACGSPDPVQACTAQIVYNIQHNPNVYGACDGLSDAQIKAASDAAVNR